MEQTAPTRLSAAIFRAKVGILQARRAWVDFRHSVPRHLHRKGATLPLTIAQSITPLHTDSCDSEQWHQRGKIANLRLAAASLDGCFIPAGQIFSFWRQVGRASASRGFRRGRMLQEGCMIPSVGGGLCQLSNAIYQVALDSGCEILERHRHSRLVPGSATEQDRDATVAWNYIDLRFRAAVDFQFTAELTHDHLVVALHADVLPQRPASVPEPPLARPIGDNHACDTCGSSKCFRKSALREPDPPNGTNRGHAS